MVTTIWLPDALVVVDCAGIFMVKVWLALDGISSRSNTPAERFRVDLGRYWLWQCRHTAS